MDFFWVVENVIVAIIGAALLALGIEKYREYKKDKNELEEAIKYLEREIGEVYKILCCGNIPTEDIKNIDDYKDMLYSKKANKGFLYTDTPIWDSLVATGNLLKICENHKKLFDDANYVFKEIKRIEKKQISEQYKDIVEQEKEILDMKQKLILWMLDEIKMPNIEKYISMGIE